jgi:hypothetical protein
VRPTWKQKRLCKQLLIQLGYSPEEAQAEVNGLQTFRDADRLIKACLPEIRVRNLSMEDRMEILNYLAIKAGELGGIPDV